LQERSKKNLEKEKNLHHLLKNFSLLKKKKTKEVFTRQDEPEVLPREEVFTKEDEPEVLTRELLFMEDFNDEEQDQKKSTRRSKRKRRK